MILPCVRQHEEQDRRYGTGRRVFNPKKKQAGRQPEWRCTGCGLEKAYGPQPDAPKEKKK